MPRALALVTLAGCSFFMTTRPAGIDHRCVTDRTGALLDLTGLAVLGGTTFAMRNSVDNPVPLFTLPVAVVYGIGALYGAAVPGCPERAELAEAATRERDAEARARALAQAERARAWAARTTQDPALVSLTKTAETRAAANDCAVVVAIGRHVREVDAEYYARVFAIDATIKRCLE
ncbi:MAG: hypothetical protein ACM31C_08655 [Acidobacteriota bacterium]